MMNCCNCCRISGKSNNCYNCNNSNGCILKHELQPLMYYNGYFFGCLRNSD